MDQSEITLVGFILLLGLLLGGFLYSEHTQTIKAMELGYTKVNGAWVKGEK